MRVLADEGISARGADILPSSFTQYVGSLVDPQFTQSIMHNVTGVLHTATLHKPHVATHDRQAFVDTNITGTLNLLEAAESAGVRRFIYTSTTSAFGDSLKPEPGAAAIWVREELVARHKNIYGVTKTAAENLCELFSRKFNVPTLVLRTSRFFPEEDDDRTQRQKFSDDNLKVNELLHRRADIYDIVKAHLAALEHVEKIGFQRLIVSATPPFNEYDAAALGSDVSTILKLYVPEFEAVYAARQWQMYSTISRVYDNTSARNLLDWEPKFTFAEVIQRLTQGKDYRSAIALSVGSKGYHSTSFESESEPT